MPEEKDEKTTDSIEKPQGSQTVHVLEAAGKRLSYSASADWLMLRKEEKPIAEVFHVFYQLEEEGTEAVSRPVTFLFNGGPGAASAYLHVGAAGPRRVSFKPDGTPPPAPVKLIDNAESWLPFTDMVFVDPVGTGFSRAMPDSDTGAEKKGEERSQRAQEFWRIQRDLDALGEFVSAFLSRHHRWDSPVFVAGESYGGFRSAKLARLLQERYGVGLNGAIMISPALDFTTLNESDYDVLHWVDLYPTLAAAAWHHGKAGADRKLQEVLLAAENTALSDLSRLLIAGDALDGAGRKRMIGRVARPLGLSPQDVDRSGGRISAQMFSRSLLRDQGLILGLYDATVTARDPFPARPAYEGPDPTLRSIERVYAAGINVLLRRELQVQTEREYHLLNLEVNRNWKDDSEEPSIFSQIQAVDDLRYAMTLNPDMRVRISHGIYDMVTPYRTSDRVVAHMGLDEPTRERLTLRHYAGGHMFYAWDDSRAAFSSDICEFYTDAIAR
jgi:carboxypeptidase C (cathepsin A)